MAKAKYKFNPNSLSYEKIEKSKKEKLKFLLTYAVALIVAGVIVNIAYFSFFDSPKEKQLKRENSQMVSQYEFLKKRVDQMDKVLEDIQNRDDNIYRVIFEAEPIPSSIREAGFGGVNRYAHLEGMKNSEIVIETAKKLDKISKQMYIQSKSYDEIVELAKNKEQMLAAIPAIMPISNNDLKRTASGWGWRIHPIYKIRKFHYGMDFTAPTGTEIYATGDGVVTNVSTSRRGYGMKIVINHGYGYETLYAHLSKFNVRKGQKVKRGDVIGFVGSTGTSTAPHLHYEVHKDGNKVNPMHFYFNDLDAEEFDKMVMISSNSGQSFD